MTTLTVELPPKLIPLFAHKRGDVRYRVLHGGRGSGKSFSVAKMAALWGAVEPLRILCVRELQNSIKESMHAELKNAISSCPWLSTQYDVGIDYLRHKNNGTEFIFRGLRHNIEAVKSMAQIDLVIAEEAETIPAASWQDLLPTIRIDKSEIIIIFNPKYRNSWVAETFLNNPPPPRSVVVELNWSDNPFFSDVLNEQRLDAMSRMDDALYRHIWEGQFYEASEAQIFNGKFIVKEFEPQPFWNGPYNGLDFGFANDPTAATKSWVFDNVLYIEHEACKVGLEIDDTAKYLMDNIPGIENYEVIADSARPESISYLKRNGLPKVKSCVKGKGSVEDGIAHLKGYKQIVIHPRCTATAQEFRLYSYKTDRLSGEILPVIQDKHNHLMDSLRYAHERNMRRGTTKNQNYATAGKRKY